MSLKMNYKHDYDKTLTRLITIIARLNNGESLSVKELAEEFNVSSRTIQRDFNERLVSLYPIHKDNKKWKMQDGYRLEKTNSVEETVILDILEKITDSLGTTFSLKAKKLLSKIKNEDFNPIYAKLDMEDISSKIGDITLIEEAIKEKLEIECTYTFEAYKKKLNLKPLKLANYEGFWYLIALDARNDRLKKYHFKSVNTIQLNAKTFNVSSDIEKLLDNSINIWFNEQKEPFEVILWVDKKATKILKRKPISQSQRIIKEYPDGSCDASVMITDEREITSIVKYWIPHIKVVSPTEIKEKIMKDIKQYLL